MSNKTNWKKKCEDLERDKNFLVWIIRIMSFGVLFILTLYMVITWKMKDINWIVTEMCNMPDRYFEICNKTAPDSKDVFNSSLLQPNYTKSDDWIIPKPDFKYYTE